ncbi:MAG: type II toxin-antitoxin system Phd/YefM family antitoxin [Spirochaetales bacterium]|nr:type II toxin-antitoxin system Phd/YefM family antitoxin [Spirochaetales bacterium]
MFMPKIIPVKELKNTVAISQMCHLSDEPIFITKNGYGDMVLMSMRAFERMKYEDYLVQKVEEAERDIAEGRYTEGLDWMDQLIESI